MTPVTIIGAGLAGCEAAWQIARYGIPVELCEMRPLRMTPAHQSDRLGELVCSNSLRGAGMHNAVGCLKEELRRCGALFMAAADATAVPAGGALAVDREAFAAYLTEKIEGHPRITLVREEATVIPAEGTVIVASGPLTSAALTAEIARLTGAEQLYFYDAIAPIVYAESLDRTIIYQASRYDDGPGDYLNCPMDQEEYLAFIAALKTAEKVALKQFEEQKYFEGCLPIEVMLARGDDTLRFGPMKPVGLPDPRTGREPYAVVQLRKENREGILYNMVGFQTKLTYPEQQRVFRLIPGMARAEFARLGSIHRNTFVCGPKILLPTLQMRVRPDVLLAGQITGVEGYVESAGSGFLAGLTVAALAQESEPVLPPRETALGALIHHITTADPKQFQPMNVNYGLFPALEGRIKKKDRKPLMAERALAALEAWKVLAEHGTAGQRSVAENKVE